MSFKYSLIITTSILSIFAGSYGVEASKRVSNGDTPGYTELQLERPQKKGRVNIGLTFEEDDSFKDHNFFSLSENKDMGPIIDLTAPLHFDFYLDKEEEEDLEEMDLIPFPRAGKAPMDYGVALMAPHFSGSYYSDEVEEDENEEPYQQNAEQPHDLIGELVEEGINLLAQKRYSDAAEQFEDILNKSPYNASANYYMGLMLLEGKIKSKTRFSANKCLEIASEAGNAYATNILISIYYAKNKPAQCAVQCDKVINDLNVEDFYKADAYYTLGLLGKNDADVIHNYIRAANLGNLTAHYNLGVYYYNAGDFKLSEQHFFTGFNAGNYSCAYFLGLMYEDGKEGVALNTEKAISIFEKGAREGNQGDCQNKMGALYEEGILVPKNLQKAKGFYLQAIKNNEEFAQENLDDLERLIALENLHNLKKFNAQEEDEAIQLEDVEVTSQPFKKRSFY